MSLKGLRFGISALLVLPLGSSGERYTIAPLENVHESMTIAAKRCLDNATSRKQLVMRCDQLLFWKATKKDLKWIEDASSDYYRSTGWLGTAGGSELPTLAEAVRWPDDPTRQIGARGIGKFTGSMLKGCEKLAKARKTGVNNINDGLLCNSHFGEMQFFHAQATTAGEPPTVTYDKIRKWGELLYNIASGYMPEEQFEGTYCNVFYESDPFTKAMLPDTTAIPCEGTKDPVWKLTTLFNLSCTNPVSSKGCTEDISEARRAKARIYATGALLHLIQDSYSQSHCERGKCTLDRKKKVAPRMECAAITRFTTYKGQKNHKDADRMPTFGASCLTESGYDDPITASAKALYHIRNRSVPETFLNDFERVFGTREQIASAQPASVGSCFGGKKT